MGPQLGNDGGGSTNIIGLPQFQVEGLVELLPFVGALVEEFGPDRCVWASDWPFLRMPERIDYGRLLDLLADQVPDTGVRRRILWDTPCREFGFPI